MKTHLWMLLPLLVLAACNKPAPAAENQPAPEAPKAAPPEQAAVITCAPTSDNKTLQWFQSGSEIAFAADTLQKRIETLARENNGWNEKEKRSENRVALRIDARAPLSEFWRFVDALVRARVRKYALAMLQEFDLPWSAGGGGQPRWELDSRYMKYELPADATHAVSTSSEYSLGLNLDWKKQFSRCGFSTCFVRGDKPILEIEELLADLLPPLSAGKKFKRSEQGSYSFATKIIEEALENAIRYLKGKLLYIDIGQSGDAGVKHRTEGSEHPPTAFMFLALDGVARFNAARAGQNLPESNVRFAFGQAKGRFQEKKHAPAIPKEKPPEEKKPEPKQPTSYRPKQPGLPKPVKPWGDPPGEFFEPKAALTICVQKLPAATPDGDYGYYFGEEEKPRSIQDVWDELAKFAMRRDVAEGHPGWSEAEQISYNVVAIRVDAWAPAHLLDLVYEGIVAMRLFRIALALVQEFPGEEFSAPSGKRAASGALLPIYRRLELPKDEGLSRAPSLPKEQITLYADQPRGEESAQYVVAIGARGRKVVENSRGKLHEVIPCVSANPDLAKPRHKELLACIQQAVTDYFVKSGARIERLELRYAQRWRLTTAQDGECFGFLMLGLDALLAINAERKQQNLPAFEIRVYDSMPLPPEPEMKPEEEVEYPKDEPPEESPTDDPVEDDR